MFSYFIIISLSKTTIFIINYFLLKSITNYSIMEIIELIFKAFLLLILIDALVAIIIHSLPEKYFNYNSKKYEVSKKERKFLEKLKIKKWKDKIPETGQLCNFKKDKIYNITDTHYLEKFLIETCYAETLHFWSAILGFLVIFIVDFKFFYFIALPEAIVNFILQVLPMLVQRYTRVRLKPVLIRALRNQKNSSLDLPINNEDIINQN